MGSVSNGDDDDEKIVEMLLKSLEDDNCKTVKHSRLLVSLEETDNVCCRSLVSEEADDGGSQSSVSPEEVENGGSQSSVFPEEADNGDNTRGGGGRGDGILKKGPWTSAEDAILVEYVQKYGEGNWSAVQKKFGLARCGKSCRLRWTNHLRPDLRKGAFSAEEENILVEQHYKLRNKWARIALALPGRTDNEIKNYWHTRRKRMKKAGLPIYPDEVVERAKNTNQPHLNVDIANQHDHDDSRVENFEIPDVVFKSFKLLPDAIVLPPYLDMQERGSIDESIDLVLFVPPSKRARLEDTTFNNSDNTTFNKSDKYSSDIAIPTFDQCENDCMLSPPCDPILDTSNELPSFQYSQTHISSSESIHGSTSNELPSFQYSQTHISSSESIHGSTSNELPSFQYSQTHISSSELIHGSTKNELPSFQYSQTHISSSELIHASTKNELPSFQYSQTRISFSEPIHGYTNNELPSFQYSQTQHLDTSRFQCVDTSIQFPTIEDLNQLVYPERDGLEYNPLDESSAPLLHSDYNNNAPLLYSDYNNNHISMFSMDEPYSLETTQVIDTPINVNFAHQDNWPDFNPNAINQNAFNQITSNSSMNGD